MDYQAPCPPGKEPTNGLPTHCPPVNAVQRIVGHALMLVCLLFGFTSAATGFYGWATIWLCAAIVEAVLTWTVDE